MASEQRQHAETCVEDIADEIDKLLCLLDVKTLCDIAEELNLHEEIEGKRNKRFVRKTLNKYFDIIVCDETMDEVSKCTQMNNVMSQLKLHAKKMDENKEELVEKNQSAVGGGDIGDGSGKSKSNNFYDSSSGVVHNDNGVGGVGAASGSGIIDGVGVKSFDYKQQIYQEPKEEGKVTFLRGDELKTSLLRKDFKIRGQIGEPSQKEKLSFISLMHQIQQGKAMGYEDAEIISGVVRAMSPSLTLRNVLETMPDLSLPRLYQFLEAHYDERNATELCSKLTSLAQHPDETPYLFVMRCIEIRQKLLLASQKSDIVYDKHLVSKLFLRTLENGISSMFVLNEIKPILRPDTPDEKLIAAVCRATSAEKQRQATQVQGSKRAIARVHSATSNVSSTDNKIESMAAAIKSLSSQVAQLTSDLATKNNSRSYNLPQCEKCRQNNVNPCKHCFKCGAEGHIAISCDKTGTGNVKGVSPRSNR